MKQRKPNPHNEPTIVTPEMEQEWLEKLEADEASADLAQANWYAQDEWFRQWMRDGREALQESQGVEYVTLM